MTALGIFLVGLMLLSVSIHIDSISVEVWNEEVDVGSISMIVHGEGVETVVDEMNQVDHVTAAALTVDALSYLRMDTNEFYHGGLFPDFLVTGQSYAITEEYMEAFPTVFTFLDGRLPRTDTEVALALNVAEYADVVIGDLMNYSIGLNVGKRPVYVCGIYVQDTGDEIFDYYYNSICIVLPELLNPDDLEYRVSVGIERSSLTPFDPQGSLHRLRTIERDLVSLYPGYPETSSVSRFYVTDELAIGVEDYMEWLAEHRFAQLARGQATILLGGLLIVLTARFYVDERKDEVQVLRARGASKRQLHVFLLKELLGLSVIAHLLALFVGIFVSRITFASVDYLLFRPISLVETPLLISLQTVIYTIVAAAILPMIGYIGSSPFETQDKPSKEEPGRLARINRGLRLIRWDMFLIVISVILLTAIYLGGIVIQENPSLILIQHLLPYPLFIGVASIATKIMNRLGENLTSLLSMTKGGVSLSIGGRRAAKDVRIAGPVLMMLVLSMCVSINGAVIASSLPTTELNHARFAMGSDITIQLNDVLEHRWEHLDNYTNLHLECEAASFVDVGTMYLSDGGQGRITFVAISPAEYSHVGYDYMGASLAASYLTESLQELETNPTGAIITENVATAYDLEIGDEFHGFGIGDTEISSGFTIIDIAPALSSPIIPENAGDWTTLGLSKIWLNRIYMSALIDLVANAATYYCIRSTTETNSGNLLNDIIGEMGIEIAFMGRRASAGSAIESYMEQPAYVGDRAVDTLITLLSFPIVTGGILFYGFSGIRRTRRQSGILRTMGAETGQLTVIHLAEVLILAFISLVVFLLYGPLFIANSLEIAYAKYRIWLLVYPILIFVDPAWSFTIPTVLAFILMVLVVSGLALTGVYRRSSFESLTHQWTRSLFQEESG
ncbi:MAG: FtsX-like permease family protein [Candidatus Thorarchaeota archaeon]